MNSLRSALDSGSRWPKEVHRSGRRDAANAHFQRNGETRTQTASDFSAGPCIVWSVRWRKLQMHPFFVSRPAACLNSIFCQILLPRGSMQQMNDWSRLAVDPARCKKSRPFAPQKTMVGQERKDNSVYPLTTTYHE